MTKPEKQPLLSGIDQERKYADQPNRPVSVSINNDVKGLDDDAPEGVVTEFKVDSEAQEEDATGFAAVEVKDEPLTLEEKAADLSAVVGNYQALLDRGSRSAPSLIWRALFYLSLADTVVFSVLSGVTKKNDGFYPLYVFLAIMGALMTLVSSMECLGSYGYCARLEGWIGALGVLEDMREDPQYGSTNAAAARLLGVEPENIRYDNPFRIYHHLESQQTAIANKIDERSEQRQAFLRAAMLKFFKPLGQDTRKALCKQILEFADMNKQKIPASRKLN